MQRIMYTPPPGSFRLRELCMRVGLFLGFSLVLFGIKLWIISSFGNETPFWDQWDAEAARLYEPFLKETLTWGDMLAPHNEHRILFPRLLALALLSLNGIWNPILQMVVNAIIHIAGLVLTIVFLTRAPARSDLPFLIFFSIVLFGLPHAYANTLSGFQSAFYCVLLFSIASLWLTATSNPLSLVWWVGVGYGILGFFSLASGTFAFAATAMVGSIKCFCKPTRRIRAVSGVTILIALFAMGVILTPSLSGHPNFSSVLASKFLVSVFSLLGWPISSSIYSAILCYLPAVIYFAGALRQGTVTNKHGLFLLALVFWTVGQAVSIAYGRSFGVVPSRYLDLFAIGILANFACLLSIRRESVGKSRQLANFGLIAWVGLIFVSLALHIDQITSDLISRRDTGVAQEINMKNYLATGDVKNLQDKPPFHVPYPNWQRLASILVSPEVRAILPSPIRAPLNPVWVRNDPPGAFTDKGYFRTTPARVGMTLGSFGKRGNLVIGRALLEFDSDRSCTVAIPVAGYPLSPGMRLDIEQFGRRESLIFSEQPRESWRVIYAKVEKGPFYIELTDANPLFWVAIGAPFVVGRLDLLTTQLLGKNFIFVSVGLWGLLGVMLWSGAEPRIWSDRCKERTGDVPAIT